MIKQELDKFAPSVDQDIKEKLYQVALAMQESLEEKTRFDVLGEFQLSPIYGVSYDGYIPFQKGGFEVSALVGNGLSSGNFLSENEREWYESLQVECEKDFKRDNNIDLDAELNEEQWEELGDYEQSYFDDSCSLIRFETWVEPNENTVFLRLSLGYKDAPYFRSKHDETLKQIELDIDELLENNVEDLINKINVL